MSADQRAGWRRYREAVGSLLWRLHLHGIKGWWDAGTDIKGRARGW